MKVIRVNRYLINVLPDHAIAEFELSRGFHELLLKILDPSIQVCHHRLFCRSLFSLLTQVLDLVCDAIVGLAVSQAALQALLEFFQLIVEFLKDRGLVSTKLLQYLRLDLIEYFSCRPAHPP